MQSVEEEVAQLRALIQQQQQTLMSQQKALTDATKALEEVRLEK